MANLFKTKGAASLGTSYSGADLYVTPGSTTTVILGLALCNKSASAVHVTAQWMDDDVSDTTYQILEQVSVPARTTLEVLAGQKYILEAGDVLRVKAGTAGQIDATLGLMEIT